MSKNDLWLGLSESARKALVPRDYQARSLAWRVSETGTEAAELAALDKRRPENKRLWIPGVEIFARPTFGQPHRGIFGELVRRDEGILAKIGLWPKQWSAARMFAHSAKGFHIHPPYIPAETTAEAWHRRLFVTHSGNYSLRKYDDEQWDVMFFLQGRAEMILARCSRRPPHSHHAFLHRRGRSPERKQRGGGDSAGCGSRHSSRRFR